MRTEDSVFQREWLGEAQLVRSKFGSGHPLIQVRNESIKLGFWYVPACFREIEELGNRRGGFTCFREIEEAMEIPQGAAEFTEPGQSGQ